MNKLTNLSSKNVFIILSVLMKIGPSLTFASYGLFLAKTLGLDPIAVNAVNQAYYIGMVSLEILTGATADKYGKRISYLVYCALYAVGSLVYFFSHNFIMAAMSEFILALGSTFQSGSFSSWAQEQMQKEGEDETSRRKAKVDAELYSRIASITCGLVGGYLFMWNEHVMWLMSSCFMIFTGIIAYLLMKEKKVQESNHREHEQSLYEIMRIGFLYIKNNKSLQLIFIQTTVFSFCIQAFNMQWQQALNIQKNEIGKIYFLMQIGIFLGVVITRKITLFSEKNFFLANAITGLFLMVCKIATGSLGINLFILHEITRGMLLPIGSHITHEKIEEGMPRATILSFDSMTSFFGGLLGLSFSGILAKYYGYQVTWIISGFILLVCSLYLVYLVRKKE